MHFSFVSPFKYLWLGHALYDHEPTIIHHFAQHTKKFKYPNVASGFVISAPLVQRCFGLFVILCLTFNVILVIIRLVFHSSSNMNHNQHDYYSSNQILRKQIGTKSFYGWNTRRGILYRCCPRVCHICLGRWKRRAANTCLGALCSLRRRLCYLSSALPPMCETWRIYYDIDY